MVVPTSAQSPLCRHDRYAETVEKSLLRRVRAERLSAYSEVLEEFEECVGGSVATGFGVEGFGAVDRLLLVGHVGVEVDVGCGDLFVAEPQRDHGDVDTTQIYLHADLALKERAIARTTPPDTHPGRYKPPDTLLAFLEAL
jgi:hypothetical protein